MELGYFPFVHTVDILFTVAKVLNARSPVLCLAETPKANTPKNPLKHGNNLI